MTGGTYIPILAAGLMFVSVVLVFAAFSGFVSGRKRVDGLRSRVMHGPGGRRKTEKTEGNSLSQSLAGAFGVLGEKITPKDKEEQTRYRRNLYRAGMRGPNALVVFWGVKGGLSIALAASIFVARMFLFPEFPLPKAAFLAVFVALMGVYLPELWLRNRVSKRKLAFLNGLPDALDLLVVCVESGMGLDQALLRAGEEMRFANKIISEEFRLLNLELRAGKSRKQALANMAKNVDLEDVTSLVTLLIQSDSFGTSVAQALKVYSDALRTKRFQRAEEMAAKLPVKLLFPLILFIFPALLVVIVGPAAITLVGVYGGK